MGNSPPMPATFVARVEDHGDSVTIHHSLRQPGLAAFMSLWLAGWTVGCLLIAGVVIDAFRGTPAQNGQVTEPWFALLFATPFYVGWFFGVAIWLNALFGREMLFVGPEGIVYERFALIRVRHRAVPADEVIRVRRFRKSTNDDSDTFVWAMRIHTAGSPVEFGAGLPVDEQRYLRHLVRATLAAGSTRRADWPTPPYTVAAEPTPPLPPSETGFHLHRHGPSLVLSIRGRWNLAGLLGLLGVTLFWNGGVGVFLGLVLTGEAPRALALFLLPFIVIGLVMLFTLLTLFAAPATRETWTVDPDGARWSLSLLGVAVSRRYRLDDLDRIVVDRETPRERRRSLRTVRRGHVTARTESHADLCARLVGRDDRVIFIISALTHGDARWIASNLAHHLRLAASPA